MNYKKLAILICFIGLMGCSSTKQRSVKQEKEKQYTILEESRIQNGEYLELSNGQKTVLEPVVFENEVAEKKEINGTKFIEVYDPLEPLNRRIYYFNYYLDKFVLIPAVNIYEFVTPTILQDGVSNFFTNLQEVNIFANSLLQIKGKKATIAFTRFLINSTLGIFGLFDVATALELPAVYEDFGLTLAKYGVGDGPYLVLPGFGPSNLRDGTGQAVGLFTLYKTNPYDNVGLDTNNWEYGAAGTINARKKNKNFRYYGTGSPFEYEYVRYLYTEYRNTLAEVNNNEK